MEIPAPQHFPSTAGPSLHCQQASHWPGRLFPFNCGGWLSEHLCAASISLSVQPAGDRAAHAPIQPRAGSALGSEAEHHCSPAAPGCLLGYEEVIQIPKGSVHIDIRELNLSINYLGEMGLGDTGIPARPPCVCHYPAVHRAWERPSKENLPLQQRTGLGVPARGWGQREAACPRPAWAVSAWPTQPLSHCGAASVLRSLFRSVTLRKPQTPPFLALPVAPWHSPLRQHVGLGIKNKPAHIFLGLDFPARRWLVYTTGFFLSPCLLFLSSKRWTVMTEGWAGVLAVRSLSGASAVALQEQEPARRPAPVGGCSGALLAASPQPRSLLLGSEMPKSLPCPAHAYWGLLVSVQTGVHWRHSPSSHHCRPLPPILPFQDLSLQPRGSILHPQQ